ncbi:MAG: adenylosuccinate lyase [Gammaproteobacteria bacterium]|nr:adenylosuccinate lyase [Gammaproteobacteria bacterium]
MELNQLTAISPIDGRYGSKTAELRAVFSEYGLIRRRVEVEIRWLQCLAGYPEITGLPGLSPAAHRELEAIIRDFPEADAGRIKEIEKTTNHDVKAVEYFIREKISGNDELRPWSPFVHFACTSEDINNLSQGLMLTGAREAHLCAVLNNLIDALCALAARWGALPMLSRTHGQPASPTTLGKELAVFIHRLQCQLARFRQVEILGKMNGAVGNFNAHRVACPEADWMEISRNFVESLGLKHNPHTTQVEPRDYMAEYFHALARINTVLVDLCRDVWGYIALDYFHLKTVDGEVGSSTMPHKVNPIDFENAEGNLGVANALLGFLAEKLPVSRWQRDLTDSTVTRNTGAAVAHCVIAYRSCLKGLEKLEANTARIGADLEDNPEVLAEAVQTVLRRHGIEDSYEKLKQLTRGQKVTLASLRDFLAGLDLPEDATAALSDLEPGDYTGNAAEQAAQIIAAWKGEKS